MNDTVYIELIKTMVPSIIAIGVLLKMFLDAREARESRVEMKRIAEETHKVVNSNYAAQTAALAAANGKIAAMEGQMAKLTELLAKSMPTQGEP